MISLNVTADHPALVALVGPAGAGKSRVARAFPAGWRLELDELRWRASGSPGDQSATPPAREVFRHLLDARLMRRLPTLVDSTNVEETVRAHLLRHARTWAMPTVAIVVPTPLETCLARQASRPAPKQVPPDAVTRQNASMPTTDQLRAEGWGQVHHATDLDLMRMLLERAATDADLLADIRADFGDDLAAVFAWDTDSEDDYSQGTFALAGRELTVRWYDDGDLHEHHWQARIDNPGCCPGPAWAKVTCPADLLDVYNAQPLYAPRCRCFSHLMNVAQTPERTAP